MNKSVRIALFFVLAAVAATSCVKKKWDEPPVNLIPVGHVLTVQDLKDTFNNVPIKFDADFSLYGTITADDKSGNLYRNFYLQDETGAILIRTLFSGGLNEGDSVRVYLKGVTLTQFSGMMQLDSVNVDKNVIKQATQRFVTPQSVTMEQVLNDPNLVAKLVRIEDVEFATGDLGLTFANAANLQTQNRNLVDCNGNTVIVRTSGYANFANTIVPIGNGSLVAIVGQFNTTKQLYIRRVSELDMTGVRCTAGPVICDPVSSVSENFASVQDNVDVALECWGNFATAGSRVWRGRANTAASNGLCVQATSFGSGEVNESWLISPPVQSNGSNTLSFATQTAFYTHSNLGVYISTNFDGLNPNNATWTAISATIAGATENIWVQSGQIPLFGFLPQDFSGAFHIGFRYNGDANANQTGSMRIDNLVIN